MSMHPRRKFALQVAGLTLAAASPPSFAHRDDDSREGKVFTSTNSPSGNELVVYAPARGGGLDLVARLATGGQGTGAGLGSQGAVTLSGDGRHLFVVNAASGTLSTFALDDGDLRLVSVAGSGGARPVSVAEYDGLVYVLNADDDGNVAGFRNVDGDLRPLADGIRGLSAAGGTAPAQVGFGADGDVLVVTERATNLVVSYPVRDDGTLGAIVLAPSSGSVPFGFAFDRRNRLIVSEAAVSAASSYRFDRRQPAVAQLVSASVANGQGAACWAAVTPNGRFAYTANAATSSISSYRIRPSGEIELANPVAGLTGPDAGALDIVVSPEGRRLYALASRSRQVVAFGVGPGGDLASLGAGGGLPAGGAGLAAN